MAESPTRVVLDTNVLVSAIIYGGKPKEILSLVFDKTLTAITSPVLLAELVDVLGKKFAMRSNDVLLVEQEIKKHFVLVYPKQTIDVLENDPPDNRVLEAAVEGICGFIVTGDKELLGLKFFMNTKITTPDQFLGEQ